VMKPIAAFSRTLVVASGRAGGASRGYGGFRGGAGRRELSAPRVGGVGAGQVAGMGGGQNTTPNYYAT